VRCHTLCKFLLAVALCFFSALAFGVEVNVNCTNQTSDTALLNNAISGSNFGDQIRIHGTCLINGVIVLLGDRSYIGDSRTGTIIQQANGANLPAMLASDTWAANTNYTGDPIRIADLTLNGNSSRNSGTNALVIRSWMTVIEDVLVENAPGDGIQITSQSQSGVALKTTEVNGRISNVFVTNSGGNGIHIVDTTNSVTDWDLLDSWVAYSGQSAIYMDNAAGWKIRGNHVYGIQQYALYANACYATTIDANYIEDFGDSGGNNTWYGIACTVQGGAASVISNNRVFMFAKEQAPAQYIYIGVPQVNYATGELNVVGNVIRGAGEKADTGLEYQLNGGKGLLLNSSNNNVQAVHTPRVIGQGVKMVDGY
jgi:hypothetical protein